MQCSSAAGHFAILAIDHRGNLRSSLDQQAERALTDPEFRQFKYDVMRHMLPAATAVLTDPDFGFGALLDPAMGTDALKGLLMPLEVTDYSIHASQRQTEFIDGWSVEKLKRVGAAGVKLLLYYHPDAPNAAHQRDLVSRIVADCQKYDVSFFLEPITYSLNPDVPLPNNELHQIVAANARTFSDLGIDILKTEFPLDTRIEPDESVWRSALQELNAASRVPWTILSAGVEYPIFRRQAELACQAGASGVIVGRAVWAEAVLLQGEVREQFLSTTALQRMAELTAICAAAAASWRDRIAPPTLAPGWYQDY